MADQKAHPEMAAMSKDKGAKVDQQQVKLDKKKKKKKRKKAKAKHLQRHHEHTWFWYRVWIPVLAGLLILVTYPTFFYIVTALAKVDDLPAPFFAFLGLSVPVTLLLVVLGASPYAHKFVGMSEEKEVTLALVLAVACTLVEAALAVVGIMVFKQSERLAARWKPVRSVRDAFEAIQITAITFVAVAVIVLLLLWVQVVFFRRHMLDQLKRKKPPAGEAPAPTGSPRGTPGVTPGGSPRGSPKASPRGSPKGSPKMSPKGEHAMSPKPT